MGYSVPKNKELMRIFRDLDMVEQLGSGIPRILAHYPQTIYHLTPNFIRLVFPYAEGFSQATKLLHYCYEPRSMKEMMAHLELTHRTSFRENILRPLLKSGELLLTMPEKPTSPMQRYISNDKNREG